MSDLSWKPDWTCKGTVANSSAEGVARLIVSQLAESRLKLAPTRQEKK